MIGGSGEIRGRNSWNRLGIDLQMVRGFVDRGENLGRNNGLQRAGIGTGATDSLSLESQH